MLVELEMIEGWTEVVAGEKGRYSHIRDIFWR